MKKISYFGCSFFRESDQVGSGAMQPSCRSAAGTEWVIWVTQSSVRVRSISTRLRPGADVFLQLPWIGFSVRVSHF